MEIRQKIAAARQFWDKHTQGWFGTLVYILLGFGIAFAANAALGLAFHTDTPVVAVFSDSMVPTYYKGDMIFVNGAGNISVGDIVVYDSPVYRYPIIHRVIAFDGDKVITKGDHNAVQDPWETSPDKIHGKAMLRVPLLGWVKILFLQALGQA